MWLRGRQYWRYTNSCHFCHWRWLLQFRQRYAQDILQQIIPLLSPSLSNTHSYSHSKNASNIVSVTGRVLDPSSLHHRPLILHTSNAPHAFPSLRPLLPMLHPVPHPTRSLQTIYFITISITRSFGLSDTVHGSLSHDKRVFWSFQNINTPSYMRNRTWLAQDIQVYKLCFHPSTPILVHFCSPTNSQIWPSLASRESTAKVLVPSSYAAQNPHPQSKLHCTFDFKVVASIKLLFLYLSVAITMTGDTTDLSTQLLLTCPPINHLHSRSTSPHLEKTSTRHT